MLAIYNPEGMMQNKSRGCDHAADAATATGRVM